MCFSYNSTRLDTHISHRQLNHQHCNQLPPTPVAAGARPGCVEPHLSGTFPHFHISEAAVPPAHPHALCASMKCADVPTTGIRKSGLSFRKTSECTFSSLPKCQGGFQCCHVVFYTSCLAQHSWKGGEGDTLLRSLLAIPAAPSTDSYSQFPLLKHLRTSICLQKVVSTLQNVI